MQNHVLGLRPAGQTTAQKHFRDFGHGKDVRFSGHGKRDGKPARADGKTAHSAGIGRMAVRSDKRLSRSGEIFKMQLVADSRSGRRIDGTEGSGAGAQKAMIVRISEAHLQGIVIHIADGKFRLYPGKAEGLELKPGHGSRRVLREGLIHADSDLASRRHIAVNKMRLNQLVSNIHLYPPL